MSCIIQFYTIRAALGLVVETEAGCSRAGVEKLPVSLKSSCFHLPNKPNMLYERGIPQSDNHMKRGCSLENI